MANAGDTGVSVAAPDITPNDIVYRRADFDLTVDRDFYPDLALQDQVEGFSIVLCQVALDGGVMQCVVDSESPGSYGFGKAHALMMLTHARFDTARYVPGTWIRNCFQWTLH